MWKIQPDQKAIDLPYAYRWIRQGVTRAIATQSRTIRLPVHVTEKTKQIKKGSAKDFSRKK
jgi:DNA-directed RNA polymerase sigma subunit (sigma70/sigma32)